MERRVDLKARIMAALGGSKTHETQLQEDLDLLLAWRGLETSLSNHGYAMQDRTKSIVTVRSDSGPKVTYATGLLGKLAAKVTGGEFGPDDAMKALRKTRGHINGLLRQGVKSGKLRKVSRGRYTF